MSAARLAYTDPALVTGVRVKETLARTPVSGYGGKIPTRYMIRYLGIWRRVYAMVYGNSGTAYILVRGTLTVLDIDTEYRLRKEP